jgi:hypothetical protein
VTDLQKQIERVKKSLEAKPGETPPTERKMVKKVVKKVKKVAKKAGNGAGRGPQETPEGFVSVAELAAEAEITPQSARVKLRTSDVERPEGRWLWKSGSSALKAARKVLGLS